MTSHQTFTDPGAANGRDRRSAGVEIMPLAQPVPDGSIHRARLPRARPSVPHHPPTKFVLVCRERRNRRQAL